MANFTAKVKYCAALVFFVLCTGNAMGQASPPADESPRLELRIFRYGGVVPSTEDKFSVFYHVLTEKLKHLKREALIEGLDVSYLDEIAVTPSSFGHLSAPPSGTKLLRATWEFHKKHLLILTGLLEANTVTTSLYWGDLKPPSFAESIEASLEVSGKGMKHARDTHSLVVLVALAMDAQRCGRHSSIVLHLLQKARDKAVYLQEQGLIEDDLLKLKNYIDEQIARYVS